MYDKGSDILDPFLPNIYCNHKLIEASDKVIIVSMSIFNLPHAPEVVGLVIVLLIVFSLFHPN